MSSPRQLETISRNRVANVAIERIKSLILSGELGPHDRLPTERELAEQLGISRPTIREAIRALIAMNILESRHGAGTYVSSLDPRELAEPIDFLLRVDEDSFLSLFETRQVLETGLVRLAAVHATPEEIAELRRLMDSYRDTMDDPETCIHLDIEFHDCIAKAARNPILASLLSSVARLALESRRRTGRSAAVREATVIDHGTIIAAIEARDGDAAARAMHDHLQHAQSGLDPSAR
jgi:GntR family transcriptional repressor for pyruvate dehydrogenase complex